MAVSAPAPVSRRSPSSLSLSCTASSDSITARPRASRAEQVVQRLHGRLPAKSRMLGTVSLQSAQRVADRLAEALALTPCTWLKFVVAPNSSQRDFVVTTHSGQPGGDGARTSADMKTPDWRGTRFAEV